MTPEDNEIKKAHDQDSESVIREEERIRELDYE